MLRFNDLGAAKVTDEYASPMHPTNNSGSTEMPQDRWRDDDDNDRSGNERRYGQMSNQGGYRGGEERQNYGQDRNYGQPNRHGRNNSDNNSDYRGGGYNTDSGHSQNRGGNYNNPNYDNNSRGRSSGERGMWDRASDEVSSWFGDDNADRRRQSDQGRGEHYGRGPKGYTRSDERIGEDVNDRLTDDSRLDASEIEVEVSDGEVTLTGTVTNREDKRYAEDVAEGVSGVKHIQNNLRVKRDMSQSQSLMSSAVPRTGASGTLPTPSGSSSGRKDRS